MGKNMPPLKLKHETQTQSFSCLNPLEQKHSRGPLVFPCWAATLGQAAARPCRGPCCQWPLSQQEWKWIYAWPRDTQEAESAWFTPAGSQSAAMDEQVGYFKVRDKKRCCRAGQWYLGDFTTVQCALDLGLADPRLAQSDTGYYTGGMWRE